jgi:hypothetical protein
VRVDEAQSSAVVGPIKPLSQNGISGCKLPFDGLVALQDGRVLRIRVSAPSVEGATEPVVRSQVVIERDAPPRFGLAVGKSLVGTTRKTYVVGAVYDDDVLVSVTLDPKDLGSVGFVATDDGALYKVPDPYSAERPEALAGGLDDVCGLQGVQETRQLLVVTRRGELRMLSVSGEPVWWSAPTPRTLLPPLVYGGNAYAFSAQGHIAVYPIGAEGLVAEPIREMSLGKHITTPPVLANGAFHVLGADPSDPDQDSLYAFAAGIPVNVARGKPTSQSSTSSNGVSSRAVDGNTSGHWQGRSVTHTNSETGAWWRVDFGAPHAVTGITIWNRTDCCGERLTNFDVQLLDASGDPIASVLHADAAEETTHVAETASGVYSVRVALRTMGVLSLAEVQVWGKPE